MSAAAAKAGGGGGGGGDAEAAGRAEDVKAILHRKEEEVKEMLAPEKEMSGESVCRVSGGLRRSGRGFKEYIYTHTAEAVSFTAIRCPSFSKSSPHRKFMSESVDESVDFNLQQSWYDNDPRPSLYRSPLLYRNTRGCPTILCDSRF